jgi:hypothetical protein
VREPSDSSYFSSHCSFLIPFSPLHVLRDHLQEITGITPPSQVLILCDLTDPDRNRDILLSGRDYESLFDCGIRDESFLTLHQLGNIRPNQNQERNVVPIDDGPDVYLISTPIAPAQADHSYNGVIFDIESKGSNETQIISFSFGGMLGRVVSCCSHLTDSHSLSHLI